MPILAIAAATAYSLDQIAHRTRFELAQTFVKLANRENIPVFLADNSQDPSVLERLSNVGAYGAPVSDTTRPPLGRAEALVAALASGADFILLTEPEKTDIVRFASPLGTYARATELDIVIARRDPTAMLTHPHNMRSTEPGANQVIADLTGLTFDWMMGAHLLSRAAAERYVLWHRQPEAFWVGGQTIAALSCVKAGLRIDEFIVKGYRYPKIQQAAEENDPAYDQKRAKLAKEIPAAVAAYWN